MKSLDRLSALALETPIGHLLPLVESWPGLAMLARMDGSTIAASEAWGPLVGITPAELRVHGWRHFVVEEDGNATDDEVEAMSGPKGRPAVRFRNRYRSSDGMKVTRLEWQATPFLGEEGVTLATVSVIGERHGGVPGEVPVPSPLSEEVIAGVIRQHRHNRWHAEFAGETDTYRWVALLDGEVIFSEGAGHPPGHFVGKRLGVDFGANPGFFDAVRRLTAPGADRRLTQFGYADDDNERFRGQRFVNRYTLVYSPGGRPMAVAVTTMEISGAVQGSDGCDAVLGSDGYCQVTGLRCPHHKKV